MCAHSASSNFYVPPLDVYLEGTIVVVLILHVYCLLLISLFSLGWIHPFGFPVAKSWGICRMKFAAIVSISALSSLPNRLSRSHKAVSLGRQRKKTFIIVQCVSRNFLASMGWKPTWRHTQTTHWGKVAWQRCGCVCKVEFLLSTFHWQQNKLYWTWWD